MPLVAGRAATARQRARRKVKRELSWTMIIVMWIMNVKTPVIVMMEGKWDEGTTQWKGGS